MIERFSQTFKIEWAGEPPLEPGPPALPVFYFPRAALLEYSFRIQVTSSAQNTADWCSGVRLGFGIGNPPQFGFGDNQGTTFVPLPAQPVGRQAWGTEVIAIEREIEILKQQLATMKAKAPVQAAQEKFVSEAAAAAGLTTPEGLSFLAQREAIRLEIHANEGEVKTTELSISKAESRKGLLFAEEPTNWSPLVTVSLSRSFDALIIAPQPPLASQFPNEVAEPFSFEHTIEVSRAQDLGPTPTVPSDNHEPARG